MSTDNDFGSFAAKKNVVIEANVTFTSLSHEGNVCDTRDNKVVKFITGRKRL